MTLNIMAINAETHADLKVVPARDFAQVKDQNLVTLVVYEFTLCACEYPIIFIKGQETGKFQPAALMGFKQGENYFVKDNKWRGLYIPGIIATYPFRIVPHPDGGDQLFMAADMNSPLVGTEKGEALFNADKTETPFFSQVKADVSQYYQQVMVTENFCKILADMDLFSARDLNVEIDGEKVSIQGVYLIDDEKLDALSDENFLKLRQQGLLPAIYAHKNSAHQIRHLAGMSRKPA